MYLVVRRVRIKAISVVRNCYPTDAWNDSELLHHPWSNSWVRSWMAMRKTAWKGSSINMSADVFKVLFAIFANQCFKLIQKLEWLWNLCNRIWLQWMRFLKWFKPSSLISGLCRRMWNRVRQDLCVKSGLSNTKSLRLWAESMLLHQPLIHFCSALSLSMFAYLFFSSAVINLLSERDWKFNALNYISY